MAATVRIEVMRRVLCCHGGLLKRLAGVTLVQQHGFSDLQRNGNSRCQQQQQQGEAVHGAPLPARCCMNCSPFKLATVAGHLCSGEQNERSKLLTPPLPRYVQC